MKNIPIFRGCFMRDELPRMINKEEATIVNLDSHQNPGTHWVALYNSSKDLAHVYYFDSFGMPPPKEVESYLRKSGKLIQYNTSQLQMLYSSMCGYYCCYVLKELYRGKSFYDVLYAMKQMPVESNETFLIKYFKL